MGESLATNALLASCGYRPPVDALLTLGAGVIGPASWLDYRAPGLGAAGIPRLLRLPLDPQLHMADGDDPAARAPVHACAAPGQPDPGGVTD